MTYSPDTLALNPELAALQKRSRAKTPGGKGYGYTPDTQAYAAAGQYVHPPANEQLINAAKHFVWLYERHAPHCTPETIETVREMVREVIEDGTAIRAISRGLPGGDEWVCG